MGELTFLSTKRDALTELDAADRLHREALKRWRALQEREARLRTSGLLTENGRERRLDELECEIALVELGQERERAARELRDARSRLQQAKVDAANAKLPELLEAYGLIADALIDERRRLEKVWVRFVASAWRHLELVTAERQAAARVTKAAKEVAPDDEVRRSIELQAADAIPVAVDLDGVAKWSERPGGALFEAERGDEFDLRSDTFFEVLGRLVRAGRERGRQNLGRVVLEAVDRELERGE